MFKFQLTENKMIAITASLVVLMAFPTYQTLAQNDESLEAMVLSSSVMETSRTPASVPAKSLPIKNPSAALQNIDLKCAQKERVPLTISGHYVQFQGKSCAGNFKDGDVEIINRTNGFTASIFQRGNDQYQTDLIQLQSGENEITIRYRQASGKPIEEVIVVRASSF